MTILIKGMEMPKEGSVLVIDSCGGVWSNTWPTRGYIRVDKAKAVEVPTPHGRLIDAYAAIMLLQKYYGHVGEPLKEHAIGECIMIIKDDAPTVIEAEAEENE